jgi:brefeldin A-resistance guanine nucleotide exchange factor 1
MIDPVHLLEPFLEILKTGHANGPITNAALTSLEKFITFHIIGKH